MTFQTAAAELEPILRGFPSQWDGKTCILEMKNVGSRHWRQMEWIGFYFQHLCDTRLSGLMTIPGPSYGNAAFDGFRSIPWDFKAHALNASRHEIIVNDREAIEGALRDYQEIGILLALGDADYNDENHSFKRWHDALKGGTSGYEKQRIQRGAWSRLRKTSFRLRRIFILRITRETLERSGSFQRNFRNADGRPRREKMKLDLRSLDNERYEILEFDE